jgi:hypothetical protein
LSDAGAAIFYSPAKTFLCGSERIAYFFPRARMDGRGFPLPTPNILFHPISSELKATPGFHNLQTYYPGLSLVCKIREPPTCDFWLDHKERVVSGIPVNQVQGSGLCKFQVESNTKVAGEKPRETLGYRKITHLLDPVQWLQGKYSLPRNQILPWHAETWGHAWKKLQDPMNQAYVEALACYGLGKLREEDYSPHFHAFYGAICAQADTYSYNISDTFMSFRHCRWFWTSQEKKIFRLGLDASVSEEVRTLLITQPDELDSDEDSEEDSDEGSESESHDIESLSQTSLGSDGFNSLQSANDSDFEEASQDTSETGSDDSEELNIYAEIEKFPVMMLFTEASEGTMDDLLDDYEAVGANPGTSEWDQIWSAWIFQIISALTVAQRVMGFIHNDLHSNNIVWTKTNQDYLYYTTREGLLWKVPTYGRIFRIIDFGRAIFTVNQTIFFSDDFRKGNDAAGQYNFGELYDSSNGAKVPPNPSFDLSRFAVSVFESLFPQSPPVKEQGVVLSKEPGLTIRETVSNLYNLLWTWLLCDDGRNVLMNPDGRERYPDFDLYKVIAAHVHDAIPEQQLRKPAFEPFRVQRKDIPDNIKLYHLFC